MSRKICVVTGTRAEFGLLRWLMAHLVEAAPQLSGQITACSAACWPMQTRGARSW